MATGRAVVFWSRSECIFHNLALEEWFLQRCAQEQGLSRALLLYCNTPSVVIGRNQNPWAESNLWLVTRNKAGGDCRPVSLARRYSGGGTVVHDEGNLNFSFIVPKSEFSRRKNTEWLAGTIQEAFPELNLVINERNDLLSGNCKVSGSAYRLTGAAALHHGTLLVRSNLTQLRQLLSGTELKAEMQQARALGAAVPTTKRIPPTHYSAGPVLAAETLSSLSSSTIGERDLSTVATRVQTGLAAVRGTVSVRSPVVNLADVVPSLQPNEVARICIERFQKDFGAVLVSENDINWTSVRNMVIQLLDPEWILGETPTFQMHLAGLSLDRGVEANVVLSALRKGAWLDKIVLKGDSESPATEAVIEALQSNVGQLLEGRCRLDGHEIAALLQRWSHQPIFRNNPRMCGYLSTLGEKFAECLPPIHRWLHNQRDWVLERTFPG